MMKSPPIDKLHEQFLLTEIEKLLPVGTFASLHWKEIGNEMNNRLNQWPDEDDEDGSAEFARLNPIDALYIWATKGTWLITDDEGFIDDTTNLVELAFWCSTENTKEINPLLSAIEQLAIYGLWLLKVHLGARTTEKDWTYSKVSNHRSECLLFAYQALVFALKIKLGTPPNVEEIEKSQKEFFSKAGKAGADKRHAPMKELRDWTIEQYKAGSWIAKNESANKAAHDLKEKVLAHGKIINPELAILSEQNAQRTIAEWIRKSA
jgi:hypothetical protein